MILRETIGQSHINDSFIFYIHKELVPTSMHITPTVNNNSTVAADQLEFRIHLKRLIWTKYSAPKNDLDCIQSTLIIYLINDVQGLVTVIVEIHMYINSGLFICCFCNHNHNFSVIH